MSLPITKHFSLLLAAVTVLCFQSQAAQAQAQIIGIGQPSYQPQPIQQPVYQPPYQQPGYGQPIYVNPNPVVIDTGDRFGGITYDPFSGNIRLQTNQSKLRQSFFDPNRGNIDPGSYRRVDRYEVIGGVRYHVTGHEWTTNGKPHGNLNRRSTQQIAPGIVKDKNEAVGYGFGARNVQGSIGLSQPQQAQPAPQRPQSTPIRYNPF